MTQDNLKQSAALAALEYIPDEAILGVGTGSTVNYLIDALTDIRSKIDATVASSKATADRLKALGIPVIDLNSTPRVDLTIDGADEVNHLKQMIKGGGGALTREKILAAASTQFICIVDDSKLVRALGHFPLPIEVIPMARSYVAREIVKLGGDPVYRQGFTTDNGNIILDIHNLTINEPETLEATLNQITGIVSNGLFAKRCADTVIVAQADKITTL